MRFGLTFSRATTAASAFFVVSIALCVCASLAKPVESECDRDANSYQCMIEKDRTAQEADLDEKSMRVLKDQQALERLVTTFEDIANRWCCAATGLPLYGAHGDRDVTNFVYTMLSQTLARNGQHYGSEFVTDFFTKREAPDAAMFHCEGVALGAPAHVNNLMESVLQLKEHLASWLRQNEVDGSEIVSSYVGQVRTLLGRWGVARLLVTNTTSRVPPEDVPLAVLPLLDGDEDAAEERCSAGGQLYVTYREANVDKSQTTRIDKEVTRLLDECYNNGRISAHPAKFGETLLDADREAQARELFDLAVQRGSLCNPYQRPEMLLRKDLTALPVWSLESFPTSVLTGFLGIQDMVAEVTSKKEFVFSTDTETMSMFVNKGTWERTILYASHTWQDFNCAQFGTAGCKKLHALVETILDSNDAYATQCNGSLSLDLWRLSPNMTTHRSVGASNIVLQLIMPLTVKRGHTILLSIGEEAVKLDEGEMLLIDDSFENVISVVREDSEDIVPAMEDIDPMIVLHAQLCHPEFHDRALELPSKKCKHGDRR